jgi:ankyrin repeat protein
MLADVSETMSVVGYYQRYREDAMATHETSTAWKQYQPTMAVPHTLWAAAKANNAAELARLLDAGWPIDERDHRGYAPLMLAGYAGNVEATELLLARGADPNTMDLFGNTVLMGAAFKGHVAIVVRLLAAGADPDIRNHGGLDARGFALAFGRSDVFTVLHQWGRHGETQPAG